MPSSRIVCPSGLAITVRGFKTKEAGLLADRSSMKSGASYTSILSSCTLSVEDPGPYSGNSITPSGIHWGHAIVADRFYALLRVRAVTYGEKYAFDVQCSANACRERIPWELTLSELPFKPLPEATIAALKGGQNRFAATLPAGQRVWFKLQTGDGEAAASKLLKGRQQDMMTQALSARVLEIEGTPAADRVRVIADMEMSEVVDLLARFDEADGGVETEIEIECPHCGSLMEVELPLGKEFFLPEAKKKSPSTEKSSSPQGGTTSTGATPTQGSSPTSTPTGSASAASPSATSSTEAPG